MLSHAGAASLALLQTSAVQMASSGMLPRIARRIATGMAAAGSGADSVMEQLCTFLVKVIFTGVAGALASVASIASAWGPLRMVCQFAGSTA